MKSVWKKHKKKIIFAVITLVLLIGFRYAYVRFPLITGYAAKDVCSCVFIGGQDPKDVGEEELQFGLIKYASYEVDTVQKSVTATVLGMGKKTAYFTRQNGCVILNDTERKNWKSIQNKQYAVREIPLVDAKADFAKNKQLQQVIDAQFKDDNPAEPFGTRAIIVLKDGKLIGEKYAPGFSENSKHIGWSMTKSIFNALIGIAIQQKKLEGLSQTHLFPAWTDERKNISIKHLLQMNSGLSWDEDYGTVSEATTMLYNSDDMVKYAIDQGMEAPLGTHWEYSSGSSNLLSGILRDRMSFQEYLHYPYKHLFDKIGASSFIIETDVANNYVASSYAWATARDWAKFGQFFLNDGMVGDERLLPPNWIKFTSKAVKNSKGEYGAQFWLPTNKDYPKSPKDMYFADGFQGQRIFITPSEGLVIVRLGLTRFDPPDYDALVSGIVAGLR